MSSGFFLRTKQIMTIKQQQYNKQRARIKNKIKKDWIKRQILTLFNN
jgi:hypothetical protein